MLESSKRVDLSTYSVIHKSNENVVYSDGSKVVKRCIVRGENSLEKFENEIDVISDFMGASDGGHLLVPTAVVRDAPQYALIYDYFPKGSLRDVLYTHCPVVPLEMVLFVSLDMAKAVAEVHAKNVVHRDVKTANFLLDDDFKTWLTDFGSARPDAESSSNESVKRFKKTHPSGGFHKRIMDGTTVVYAAPEILRNAEATKPSDVYSLAITMCELLTQEEPYEGVEKDDPEFHTVLDATYNEQSLTEAITHSFLRPPLPQGVGSAKLENFKRLIESCWANAPLERPSAEQVVERLSALVVGVDRMAVGASAFGARNESDDIEMASLGDGDDESPAAIYTPVKVVRERRAEYLPIGAFATSGRRGPDKMEDRYAVSHARVHASSDNALLTVVSVLDGHGGAKCADYCAPLLNERIERALLADECLAPRARAERESRISRAYVEVDAEFRRKFPDDFSGATSLTACVWRAPPSITRESRLSVLIANAGDCRMVLSNSARGAVRLSVDQNADEASERARIESLGGFVKKDHTGHFRVQGHIQVTRSLGDRKYKKFGVTAAPDVCETHVRYGVDSKDEFLIIATDGVWDVMTDLEAVQAVRDTAKDAGLAAKRLGSMAIARGSTDNVTAVVLFLREFGLSDARSSSTR